MGFWEKASLNAFIDVQTLQIGSKRTKCHGKKEEVDGTREGKLENLTPSPAAPEWFHSLSLPIHDHVLNHPVQLILFI